MRERYRQELAQTTDAGRLREQKKKRTNLWRRETVHLQSLLGKLLHHQLVTNLVQMVGINFFTGVIFYMMLTFN